MKKHRAWVLAKEYLGWDGGTIHQLAKETNCSTDLLLARPGDPVEVRFNGQWHAGTFTRLDSFPLNPDGKRCARFSATALVVADSSYNNLDMLEGGVDIRLPTYGKEVLL